MDSLFFHPKFVHVPIALGVLMPLLAGGVLLSWWRQWLPARTWVVVVAMQATLLASGIAALQTGEAEEDRVERVVPEQAKEEHEGAAEVFVWGSGGILGLMLLGLALSRSKTGLPTAAVATAGTLVVLVLGHRTGEAGGDLVYRHGAASASTTSAQAWEGSTGRVPCRAGGEEHDDD